MKYNEWISNLGFSGLIETLWNVNEEVQQLISAASHRFNRNIVECKSSSDTGTVLSASGLIETLWNVNVFEEDYPVHLAGV